MVVVVKTFQQLFQCNTREEIDFRKLQKFLGGKRASELIHSLYKPASHKKYSIHRAQVHWDN